MDYLTLDPIVSTFSAHDLGLSDPIEAVLLVCPHDLRTTTPEKEGSPALPLFLFKGHISR